MESQNVEFVEDEKEDSLENEILKIDQEIEKEGGYFY